MNSNYINRQLIIWAELLYGKDAKCYSREVRKCKKGKKVYYVFGSEKLKIENVLSKQFALYLAANQLPGAITKVRYQIQYLDLETNVTRSYLSGAVFDKVKVKKEINLLKEEQKQLKKLGLPKTKANFQKAKVNII